MDYYSDKTTDYYANLRQDILGMIDFKAKTILDVGCGIGVTALEIKKKTDASFVAGIELFQDAGEKATKILDRVIIGDVESNLDKFEESSFDLIITADVLEHLADPWQVLKKLKVLLNSNGRIVASLPNLSYFPVLLKILLDKFDYEESGVLDKTHLRFFTLHTIKKMFDECGFRIIKIEANKGKGIKSLLLSILSIGLLNKTRNYQYKIIAEKK